MLNALYVEISIVGILLLVIILISQRESMGTSAPQRQFNRMIYALIAILIIDAATWVIDGQQFPYARQMNIFIESWYYFFNALMPFMWAVYSELTLNRNIRSAQKRVRWLGLPTIIFAGLVILNLGNGRLFFVDEQNVYHRGEWYIITAVFAYAYLLYSSIRALVKASKVKWSTERKQYLLMAAFIIPPTIGGVVQTFYYGVTCIWICTAISIVMVYIDMLNRQISTESLTGLNNRRELHKFLIRETREGARSNILALIMMDIDRFKEVNDTYGHYYGDGVLISVAEILKTACKNTSAFLSRIGGDEFCIVYSADDIESVEGLIAKVQYNIITWNTAHRDMVQISLSIGYSVWDPQRDQSFETLYSRADQNMYQAKRKKKLTA